MIKLQNAYQANIFVLVKDLCFSSKKILVQKKLLSANALHVHFIRLWIVSEVAVKRWAHKTWILLETKTEMKSGCRGSDLKSIQAKRYRHCIHMHSTHRHKHQRTRLSIRSFARSFSRSFGWFDFKTQFWLYTDSVWFSAACYLLPIVVCSYRNFIRSHVYFFYMCIAYICRSTFKFQCDVHFFCSFKKNRHYRRCLFKELKDEISNKINNQDRETQKKHHSYTNTWSLLRSSQ